MRTDGINMIALRKKHGFEKSRMKSKREKDEEIVFVIYVLKKGRTEPI